MKKTILSAAGFLLAGSTAWAVTFSGGGGAGTSIIDANGTGDYTTLAEAAADFTGFTGGATGNWNVLIRSDLEETTQSVFGNDTNGNTVTIRPDAGSSVTVTFNISERPGTTGAIWDGNILIGPNKGTATSESTLDPDAIHYMDTDNFIIDGSNVPGGTERNLSLITPESAHTGTLIPRFMIRVVGRVDDSAVRNCTIVTNALASGATVNIFYNARFVSEGALFYLPHRAQVENCGLKATRGSAGRGFYSSIQGSAGAAAGVDAMQGFVVSNNDIEVSHRAVQYGFNAGGEISNNSVRINQETAGNRPEVIIHTGSNNVTFPWTTDIIGNHISEVETLASTGFNYIIGVRTANAQETFNIFNNMIGGITGTATITNPGSMLGRAIAFEGGTNPGVFNIQHNSISMADIPNYGPNGEDDSSNRMSAISFFNANNFAGTVNFENNIVSYRQHNASMISNQPTHTVGGTLNFNNNTYHLDAGAKFAELNGVTYDTLADWQSGTSRDTNSNVVNPFAPPTGGAWVSDSNQHFNAEPAALFDGVAIAAVTTDIDGDTRPTPPTKGADEFVVGSSVGNWTLY